eukprot:scaffold235954_cov17-Tisochrysis_lutea.AAC.1
MAGASCSDRHIGMQCHSKENALSHGQGPLRKFEVEVEKIRGHQLGNVSLMLWNAAHAHMR